MKKAKSFNVGDKVFAKVKGYPAWPAQIVGINGKKYDVKFYGTGETGCLKPEDIFYYLKFKSQFVKSLKRKDYKDAVDEIEQEIEECGGTDGNPEISGSDTSNSQSSETTPKPAGNKRKRASSNVDGTQQKPNKVKKTSTNGQSEAAEIEIKETNDDNKDEDAASEVANDSAQEDNVKVKTEENGKEEMEVSIKEDKDDSKSDVEAEEAVLQDNKRSETPEKGFLKDGDDKKIDESLEIKDKSLDKIETKSDDNEGKEDVNLLAEYKNIMMIPQEYLTTIIDYASKIKKNEEKYKAKLPDSVSLDDEDDLRVKVFPFKTPNQNYIGLRYIPKDIDEFKSEYDRAVDDEKKAKELLELKDQIIAGQPIDPEDSRIMELKCTFKYIHQMINASIFKYKTKKLKFLKNESKLYEAIVNIKRSLALDNAQPKIAIKNLEYILEMNVEPLSLKKHTSFMDTIRRLMRYVGNMTCWSLTSEEVEEFNENAATIRDLAEKCCTKLKALFTYKDDENFFDKFEQDCNDFKELTKDVKESEVFHLFGEPYSRRSILDEIYDNLKFRKLADMDS